jgi:LytS/YehU family sensor histidine kinase
LSNTILGVAIIFVAGASWIALVNNSSLDAFYLQWHEEIWKLGILLLISIFLYEIFYGWLYSYRYFATVQVEQLQSERLQMELQFESLKSQISPHYLFNCLNTISSLLYNDDGTAEEFIRRMADTFRYVISNQQKQLVTLQEEIEFVKAYYYLLQVRYQSHLQLEVNLPSNLMNSYVPPLAVQILVENAVKHNEISKTHPLFIYLSAQDNTFINISSTKTIKSQSAQSFKIGLENIKSRYRYFTDEKVVIKDQDKFVVQLPVIKAHRLSAKLNGEQAITATLS